VKHHLKLLASGVLFGISTTLSAQQPPDVFQNLIADSAHRIAIAHQVALAKWDSNGTVEDSAREAQVIQNAVAAGQSKGLSEASLTSFFRAQIEANKLVQYSLLSDWHVAGKAPEHQKVNLSSEIRPELDHLQSALISDLAQSADARSQPDCSTTLAVATHKYLATQSPATSTLDALALNRSLAAACVR
jgi:chorismate mutase